MHNHDARPSIPPRAARTCLDPAPAQPPGRRRTRHAAGPALCSEGQHRCSGAAHHGGLSRFRLRGSSDGCRGQSPAGCWGAVGRQNEPRPVCLRTQWHPFALWRGAQCFQPPVCQRRLQCRLCPCGGHRAGGLCPGHRHGRLGPRAGWAEQHRWPQAQPWLDQCGRCRARSPECGCGVHLRADRPAGLAGVGGGGGIRCPGPLLPAAHPAHQTPSHRPAGRRAR